MIFTHRAPWKPEFTKCFLSTKHRIIIKLSQNKQSSETLKYSNIPNWFGVVYNVLMGINSIDLNVTKDYKIK